MSKLNTQPYKGVRDYYPEDMRLRQWIFDTWYRVGASFGYEPYDASVIEPLDIYTAKTSEEIVTQQTYNFEDRGGRQITLRPEMTPTVSRMVAARRQELGYPLRLISIPNCFRYERMQRGRTREFWQLNMDLFGIEGTDADIEIIQAADQIMKSFGAPDGSYTVKVNSRQLINSVLEQAQASDINALMRLIDSRDKIDAEKFNAELSGLCSQPDLIIQFLGSQLSGLPESIQESDGWKDLNTVLSDLNKAGVSSAEYSPEIARGFDYYTGVVFEVMDNNPENNRSMFGGGRYDGLVGAFGADPVATVGFGMGDVTLMNFLESWNLMPMLTPKTDAMIVPLDVDAQAAAQQLRQQGLNIAVGDRTRKMDKQIKSAEKLGISNVIFVGQNELDSGKFTLKNIETGDQQQLNVADIANALSD